MDGTLRPRTSVAIIGAGRLGRLLGLALQRAGLNVTAAWSRSADGRAGAARVLGIDQAATIEQAIGDAAIIVICVPDDATESIVEQISLLKLDGPRTFITTSGSRSIHVLDPLAALGHGALRLHPLQTISERATPADLFGVPAAITALDGPARHLGHELAEMLQMAPFDLADDDRDAWHAAAVMASNYQQVLLAGAVELAMRAGLDEPSARSSLARLSEAAIARATKEGPAVALTGPIARGDARTVRAHQRALTRLAPHLVATYRALGSVAVRLASDGARISDDQTMQLEAALRPRPEVVQSRAHLARALATLRQLDPGQVGFVPTMGALHEGHAELIRAAAAECGAVVVSCYVNPRQFGPSEDLASYPRTPARDEMLVERAGADVLWRPSDLDVYPPGQVNESGHDVGHVGGVLEGSARPGHFDGVVQVVAQLLDAVQPDVLYLGAKDYQQIAVLRSALAARGSLVQIRIIDTVREPDGLARSSRNALLSVDERAAAAAIPAALREARAIVSKGERDASVVAQRVQEQLEAAPSIVVDYVSIADPHSLEPCEQIEPGTRLLVAAHVGATRLIDNCQLLPGGDGHE